MTLVMIFTIPNERAIPMSPPKIVSMTDSTRNCSMISRLFAPIALRIPISFVRSDTVTRRIFITPIHPTMSEIAAIPQRNILSVLVIVERVSSVSAWLWTVKVALLASVILNTSRRRILIASFALSIFSALATWTEIVEI